MPFQPLLPPCPSLSWAGDALVLDARLVEGKSRFEKRDMPKVLQSRYHSELVASCARRMATAQHARVFGSVHAEPMRNQPQYAGHSVRRNGETAVTHTRRAEREDEREKLGQLTLRSRTDNVFAIESSCRPVCRVHPTETIVFVPPCTTTLAEFPFVQYDLEVTTVTRHCLSGIAPTAQRIQAYLTLQPSPISTADCRKLVVSTIAHAPGVACFHSRLADSEGVRGTHLPRFELDRHAHLPTTPLGSADWSKPPRCWPAVHRPRNRRGTRATACGCSSIGRDRHHHVDRSACCGSVSGAMTLGVSPPARAL